MADTNPTIAPRKSSREKVQAYRVRMRDRGFRQVSFWLPDTSTAEFKAEAARQSLLAARSDEDAEINAFLESANDWPSDDGDVPAHR